MVRKIKSMKRKKFKGKTYLFLDTNFLRNYKSNEENFKKSLSRLSSNYEIYVSSLTAIELKNNKTRDGIETLKLLKHVKVLPTEMEMISRQDSINYFSVNELLKTDNSEKYIKLKKYIELKNILYIFSVIQSIIEKKNNKKIDLIEKEFKNFETKYYNLKNRKDEIELIKEFYEKLKIYGIEDIENVKKEIFFQKMEQFFVAKEHEFLSKKEKILYSVGYLRIIAKILENQNIGDRKNDFFDLGFLSTNYLDAHILTQDKRMIEEFLKLGYTKVKKHDNYTILKFNDIQELTYEEIYNLVVSI